MAEVLVQLRVGAGVDDAYITSLITVARELCEHAPERSLITTAWRPRLDAFPSDGGIELLQPPIIAVSLVGLP